MTRLTVTIDADLTEQRNTYEDCSFTNIAEAIQAGDVDEGVGVYLELSIGDLVHGKLVEIKVEGAN